MPFCPECGNRLNDQDQFCPQCGHRHAVAPAVAPAITPSPASPASPPPVTPPAAGIDVPAPKKKRSGCMIAAMIGGGLLVLFALLCALIFAVVTMASSGAVDAAREHFSLLKQGEIDRAYEGTASGFRSSTTLKQYRRFVQEYPQLRDVADSSFNDRSVDNNMTTLSGTLTDSQGRESAIHLVLIKEGEQWKLLGIDLNAAPTNGP